MQATDGNLYGTTANGGTSGFGTAFRITTSGALTTLYNFCSQSGCVDGRNPVARLLQATNGEIYGTTYGGGAVYGTCGPELPGCGTIFSLVMGLGPFVETLSTFGKVESIVEILGTDLTGATRVTFNGSVTAFNVVSNSLILTTVPSGASSGIVQVVTPGGTLSSNAPFRVLP